MEDVNEEQVRGTNEAPLDSEGNEMVPGKEAGAWEAQGEQPSEEGVAPAPEAAEAPAAESAEPTEEVASEEAPSA